MLRQGELKLEVLALITLLGKLIVMQKSAAA